MCSSAEGAGIAVCDRQEREIDCQEDMAPQKCLAAKNLEDQSLLKSLLGQTQLSMMTTHTDSPAEPRSSHVELFLVAGCHGFRESAVR